MLMLQQKLSPQMSKTQNSTDFLAFVLFLKGSTHLFGCHHALKCYSKSKLYIAFPAPSIILMKIEWVVTMASANLGLKNVNALQRQEIPSIWSDLWQRVHAVPQYKQDTRDSLWRAHVKQTMRWDSAESLHAPLALICTHHSPLPNRTTQHLPLPAN